MTDLERFAKNLGVDFTECDLDEEPAEVLEYIPGGENE